MFANVSKPDFQIAQTGLISTLLEQKWHFLYASEVH